MPASNFSVEFDVQQELDVIVTGEPTPCVGMRPFGIKTGLPGFGQFTYEIGLPDGHEPSLDPNINKSTVGGLASQNANSTTCSGFNTKIPVNRTEDFTVELDVCQELNVRVVCVPSFCAKMKRLSFETFLPGSGTFKYQFRLPKGQEPLLDPRTDKSVVHTPASQDANFSTHDITSAETSIEKRIPETTGIGSLPTVPETQISRLRKQQHLDKKNAENSAQGHKKRKLSASGEPGHTDGIFKSVKVCPSTPETENSVIATDNGRD